MGMTRAPIMYVIWMMYMVTAATVLGTATAARADEAGTLTDNGPMVKPSVGVHFHAMPDAVALNAGYLPLTIMTDIPAFATMDLHDPCAPGTDMSSSVRYASVMLDSSGPNKQPDNLQPDNKDEDNDKRDRYTTTDSPTTRPPRPTVRHEEILTDLQRRQKNNFFRDLRHNPTKLLELPRSMRYAIPPSVANFCDRINSMAIFEQCKEIFFHMRHGNKLIVLNSQSIQTTMHNTIYYMCCDQSKRSDHDTENKQACSGNKRGREACLIEQARLMNQVVAHILTHHIYVPRRRKRNIETDVLTCESPMLRTLSHDVQLFASKVKIVKEKEKHLKQTLQSFQPRYDFRNARGLLDFVGEGLSYLFGTVSQTDLKGLKLHLAKLYSNVTKAKADRQILQESIINLATQTDQKFEAMVSFVNRTAQANREILEKFNQQQQVVQDNQKRLAKSLHRTATDINVLKLALYNLRAHVAIDYHSKHLDDWLHALIGISAGKLPTQIIPEDELMKTLKRANQFVQTIADGLHVPFDPAILTRIYQLRTTRMVYMDKYIMFIVQVPILLAGPSFDVYRVEVLPTPIPSSNGQAQATYTLLTDMPDYLAISKDGSQFLHLEYQEYQHCIEREYGFCTSVSTLMTISSPTCAYAIFADFKYQDLKNICNFQIVNQRITPRSVRISDAMFLFLNLTETLSLQCRSRVSFIHPAPSLYVKIPCGCQLKGEFFTSPPAVSSCRYPTRAKVLHTVNYPILALFDLHMTLPDKPTLTFSDTVPKVDLPNFNGTFKELEKQGKLRDGAIKFKTLLETQQNLARLPADLEEAILADVSFDLSDVSYSTYALFAWMTILTVLTIHLCIKTRQTANLVGATMIASGPRIVSALQVQTPPNQQAPPEPIDDFIKTVRQILLHPMTITLIILVFMVVLSYLIKNILRFLIWCKPKCGKVYRVCPLIASPDIGSSKLHFFLKMDTVMLYVTSIPYEPMTTLIVTHPVALTARYTICPYPQLHLTWSSELRFMLYDMEMVQSFPTMLIPPMTKQSIIQNAVNKDTRRYLLYRTDEDKRYHVLPRIQGVPFNPAFAHETPTLAATAPQYPLTELRELREMSSFQPVTPSASSLRSYMNI